VTATNAHLTGAVARLALNYGRALDAAGIATLVDTWRSQLATYEAEDIDSAVDRLLGDANVRSFPTVANVAVLAKESRERRQRTMAHLDEHGTVACLTCDDSGWLDAGSDEDSYEYVRPCPQGCKPPLPTGRREAQRRKKHRPSGSQRLAGTLPADVIEAQNRMQGDRPHPHDEAF